MFETGFAGAAVGSRATAWGRIVHKGKRLASLTICLSLIKIPQKIVMNLFYHYTLSLRAVVNGLPQF